jgi:hypothetical protein
VFLSDMYVHQAFITGPVVPSTYELHTRKLVGEAVEVHDRMSRIGNVRMVFLQLQ